MREKFTHTAEQKSDKSKRHHPVHIISSYKSVDMRNNTLTFVFIAIIVLQIGIADTHRCQSGFFDRIVDAFTPKVECEACAHDGSCLGQVEPISDHSMFKIRCRAGYMRDEKGFCRRIVQKP